ncbi:unnamed protein product [Leuciscus chuanchicus]
MLLLGVVCLWLLVHYRKDLPPCLAKIFGDTDSDSEPEGGIKRRYHNLSTCLLPLIPPPTPDIPSSESSSSGIFLYFPAAPPPFNTAAMPSSPLRHCSVGYDPDLMHPEDGYCTVPPVVMPTSQLPSRSMGHISTRSAAAPTMHITLYGPHLNAQRRRSHHAHHALWATSQRAAPPLPPCTSRSMGHISTRSAAAPTMHITLYGPHLCHASNGKRAFLQAHV